MKHAYKSLAGVHPQILLYYQGAFMQAQRVKKEEGKQGELGI